jgi:hypothetical protein
VLRLAVLQRNAPALRFGLNLNWILGFGLNSLVLDLVVQRLVDLAVVVQNVALWSIQ